MNREDLKAMLGTVASGWGQPVPCLFGWGKFCLVHWRFCADARRQGGGAP